MAQSGSKKACGRTGLHRYFFPRKSTASQGSMRSDRFSSIFFPTARFSFKEGCHYTSLRRYFSPWLDPIPGGHAATPACVDFSFLWLDPVPEGACGQTSTEYAATPSCVDIFPHVLDPLPREHAATIIRNRNENYNKQVVYVVHHLNLISGHMGQYNMIWDVYESAYTELTRYLLSVFNFC